jgi:hypothetical protein
MAVKRWESIKVRYCTRVRQDVRLEAQVIYPADNLPDQAPQVAAHRCSHAFACSLEERSGCTWAGTNPGYDPFKETETK